MFSLRVDFTLWIIVYEKCILWLSRLICLLINTVVTGLLTSYITWWALLDTTFYSTPLKKILLSTEPAYRNWWQTLEKRAKFGYDWTVVSITSLWYNGMLGGNFGLKFSQPADCFRSVFDRQTGAFDGQTRVYVVVGQTIMRLWSEYRLWYKGFVLKVYVAH